MKTIIIDTSPDGGLNLAQLDLINYLKNHKFRLFPKKIHIRISYCLPTITYNVGSSLTTKYVITEGAKRVYCIRNEKLYSELSDF